MHAKRMLAWTLGCAIAYGAAGAAAGSTCYVVLDRTDVVIYRDVVPPYDLSDPKSPERARMRARGEHMLIADFDKCEPAGFISPTTGGTTASVDDIVTQLKPAIAPSVGSRNGASSEPPATPPPAPRPATIPGRTQY
jgi:hypothetical protein